MSTFDRILILLERFAEDIVGQVMTGTSVAHSGALDPSDRDRAGVDGKAQTVRLLATQVDTAEHDEVVAPDPEPATGTIADFRRWATREGVVSASLGIGCNTPWRQVHGLLLLAAARTEGILSAPPPRVIQRALLSFDNEYVLDARVAAGYACTAVLWKLNAQVQDTFEEYGVPIVTPAFERRIGDCTTVPLN